jgi:hypothetical protein
VAGNLLWVLALNVESHLRRRSVQSSGIVKPPPKRLDANIVAISNALQFVEAIAKVSALKPCLRGFQAANVVKGEHQMSNYPSVQMASLTQLRNEATGIWMCWD